MTDDGRRTGREPSLGGAESTFSGDEPSLSAEFVVAQLLETVPGGDKHTRRHAFGELKRIKSAALPKLLDALKVPNWKIRRAAALALQEINSADAVPGLLTALRDPSKLVRRTASDALRKVGNPAVPGLLEAVSDPDEDVSQRAKWLLVLIKDSRLVPYHLAIVRNLDNEPQVRGASVSALGRLCDTAATETLRHALKDSNSSVRREAAQAFTTLNDASAVEDLIEAMHDTYLPVRVSAANALGAIRDRRAVPALIATLSQEEPAIVHIPAISALGKIGDTQAVPALIEQLSVSDNILWAINVLGRLHDARALASLQPLLNHPSSSVRTSVEHAIRQIENN